MSVFKRPAYFVETKSSIPPVMLGGTFDKGVLTWFDTVRERIVGGKLEAISDTGSFVFKPTDSGWFQMRIDPVTVKVFREKVVPVSAFDPETVKRLDTVEKIEEFYENYAVV